MEKENLTNRKKRKHNKNLSESAMYDFLSMIKYKSEWYGTKVCQVGQFEPSTIVCNKCGYKVGKLNTKIREWDCPNCGTHHDRDMNAAIVLKNIAEQRLLLC